MNPDCITICRMCFKAICKNSSKLIEEITREVIDVLLLPLDLNISRSPVMCKGCEFKLQAAFDFKSICLDTEDLLFPFQNEETDLSVIYSKMKTKNRAIGTKSKGSICRLCFKSAQRKQKMFCQLRENNPDLEHILATYFPEIALDHFDQPTVCPCCINSLNNFSNFLAIIQDTERTIKNYIEIHGTDHTGRVELEHIRPNNNPFIKQQFDDKNERVSKTCANGGNGMEVIIKSEPKENVIKVEAKELTDEVHLVKEENLNAESQQKSVAGLKRRKRGKYQRHKPLIVRTFQCSFCPYRTNYMSRHERHAMTHKGPSNTPMYRCDKCDFQTKHEWYLPRHAVRHEDQSTRPKYECKLCPFKSFHKYKYTRHMLYHSDPSKAYTCESCQFRTFYKSSYKYHQLSHKKDSELVLLKCHHCDFQSRHRSGLVQHVRIHREVARLFDCHICEYKGKTKICLRKHLNTHKPNSEVTMYQCPECSYETRHKYTLKIHSVIHKSPSETTMYECDRCTYRSKFKSALRDHRKTHDKREGKKKRKSQFLSTCDLK